MKKSILMVFTTLWALVASAQPRPYEIDPSFIPTLEFMQKSWTGEYDGLEPNSRMILSIKRSLVLNPDMTYINEVKGQVKQQLDEVLLRYEVGTYQYNSDTQTLTCLIESEKSLDINILLQGDELKYIEKDYKQEETEKTSSEMAQFTRAATDDARQWVLFDQKLMSPINPVKQAVYVMTGTEIETDDMYLPLLNSDIDKRAYDLNGRPIYKSNNGLLIIKGKKVITP